MDYCARCMWGDKCSVPGGCGHFDPLDDTHLEISYNKNEFRREWLKYIEQEIATGGDWDD